MFSFVTVSFPVGFRLLAIRSPFYATAAAQLHTPCRQLLLALQLPHEPAERLLVVARQVRLNVLGKRQQEIDL